MCATPPILDFAMLQVLQELWDFVLGGGGGSSVSYRQIFSCVRVCSLVDL